MKKGIALPTQTTTAVTLEEGARPICTVALGAFCESHGPTIVFTTQAFPSASLVSVEDPDASQSPAYYSVARPAFVTPSSSLVFVPRAQPQEITPVPSTSAHPTIVAASAPLQIPTSPGAVPAAGSSTAIAGDSPSSPSPSQQQCLLCESLPESEGFISTDDDTDTVFVSKRTMAESYGVVRTACVRALSCEWSGTPVGPQHHQHPQPQVLTPVFYGNSAIGFTLSFLFRIEDAASRGQSRWYTVVSTWQDPMYLVCIACAGMLTAAIEPVVRELQARAKERLRGAPKKQRGLAELVEMSPRELFCLFHVSFCRALLACDRGLFTSPLAVPPLLPTRSLIVGPFRRPSESLPESAAAPDQSPFRLTSLMVALGQKGVRILLYNAVVGNQVVVRAPHDICRPAVRAISRLLPDSLRGSICEYSPEYKQPWEAHFLGMPLDSVIPPPPSDDDDDPATQQLARRKGHEARGLDKERAAPAEDLTGDFDGKVVVTIFEEKKATAEGPVEKSTLVEEIRSALEPPSRCIGPATLQSMRLQLVHEKWLNIAKLVTALRSRGAFNTEQGTRAALAALHVNRKDLRALRFWAACVRTRMLTPQQ